MSTYSGTVPGASGQGWYRKDPAVSPIIVNGNYVTLGPWEYITSISFSGIIQNESINNSDVSIYFSDTGGNNAYLLKSIHLAQSDGPFADSHEDHANANVLNTGTIIWGNLRNKTLALKKVGGYTVYLSSNFQCTITTAICPPVNAGDVITKEQMDALRNYLSRGTWVTKGDQARASVGSTYYTVSAGTPINASWYNQ